MHDTDGSSFCELKSYVHDTQTCGTALSKQIQPGSLNHVISSVDHARLLTCDNDVMMFCSFTVEEALPLSAAWSAVSELQATVFQQVHEISTSSSVAAYK